MINFCILLVILLSAIDNLCNIFLHHRSTCVFSFKLVFRCKRSWSALGKILFGNIKRILSTVRAVELLFFKTKVIVFLHAEHFWVVLVLSFIISFWIVFHKLYFFLIVGWLILMLIVHKLCFIYFVRTCDIGFSHVRKRTFITLKLNNSASSN